MSSRADKPQSLRDLLRRNRIARRVRRRVQRQRLLRLVPTTHLFDRDYYEAQRGRRFDSDHAALADFLVASRTATWSPNVLFEAQWFADKDVKGSFQPFATYVTGRRRRAPGPMFDEAGYLAAHPEAGEHPGHALGHFLEHVRDDDLVPVPDDYPGPAPTFGETRARLLESARRQSAPTPVVERSPLPGTGSGSEAGDPALVTVVLPVRDRAALVGDAVRSVQAQTYERWELVVVDDGSTDGSADAALAAAGGDPRVRVVRGPAAGLSAARNLGAAAGSGALVCFLDSDFRQAPAFLAASVQRLESGADAAFSAVEQVTSKGARTVSGAPTAEALVAGGALDINGLVLTRALFTHLGGFDESQRRWVHLDLVLRMLPVARCTAVADVGARGVRVDDSAPRLDRSESDHWFWVAVGRHVVDWDAVDAGLADRDADLVSIVMPTYEDWRMTVSAVASVLSASEGHQLEILVVDNGSERSVTSILEARFVSRPEVRILRQKRNLNFAIGCNVGMAASTGSRIVFLNNDTDVMPGWLDPLLDGLDDDGVRGTQPLLLYPDGTIQSAGSLLPGGDSPPIALLAGYPPEDARRVESLDLRVVTAAAVAVRADEFAALRGYDPIFVNGQEDVDYCLRAVDRFGGAFRVVTGATVIHHESKTPGRGARIQANRRILVDRWRGRLAADDPAAMAGTGLTITRWNPPGDPRDLDDVRIPTPVVERIASVSVQESLPSLRWAITIAAHPGPRGDVWGDTHFAAALTTSLERLGQQVVVDRREAYNRPTSGIDDVQLVLRGLEEVPVSPGRVNLLWVISHPDLVTERELVSYQRVFAASASWAGRCTAGGLLVLPLLQATDPALFNPGKHDETEHDAVVFVGRSRNILRPVIRDAVEAGISPVIFGDGWEAFDLGHLVRAPYLEPDDVAVLYASAGVVLNDHWADMARDGFLSNRLFDAVASGARVVTDEVDADLSLFGGAVQAYRDVADLRELCSLAGRDRFPDDAARREIAAAVAREHSFDARAHQLVDAALQVRAEQGWAPRR